jgi:hypothetical protein
MAQISTTTGSGKLFQAPFLLKVPISKTVRLIFSAAGYSLLASGKNL